MGATIVRCTLRVALATSLALLAGCGLFRGSSCAKPGAYTQAKEVPPLRIPEGLDAPDTRGALKIPAAQPAAAAPPPPRTKDTPCLDQPPKYSTNAPAAPAR